ncbi:FAD-dependent monooxygenase [Streptomyces sp. B1I3]|uniref:FAD-dependent monooxygenase n=1 Tax=Streptomyces sp. B1I3 TaxID=3042264 RepID=UPI002789623C|nr:FAD-dependent monooxygenase [Streptomyces sp. B1I3]MDQ0793033.1 2-polyprenyl-6-methoxyphenol hydroxylase-like FAD-dependent oxidoreductase [Streptomyces sp. B1I3]
MRIAIIGAGPGGLYTAALVKRLRPGCEIDVWEANAPDETFGFGVVFSEGALGGIEAADPRLFARLAAECAQWSRIDVHHRGRTMRNGGYRFSAIGRRVLLSMLRTRCEELGVTIRYGTRAPEAALLAGAYDLVVAADGVNSSTREAHREKFGTERGERGSRYLWLGTDRTFTALTFAVADTEFGSMHAHAYPYAPGLSTFIVEVDDHVREAAGFTGQGSDTRGGGRADGGPADVDRIAGIFADVLEGHRLRTNRSRWGRFSDVRNRCWSHGNIVLLGDSAHTTHFSIGSGTRLAMEDGLALALAVDRHGAAPEALTAYEAERRPDVESMQRTARISQEWFEELDQYTDLGMEAFNAHLITRSGRLTQDDLPPRPPDQVELIRDRFAEADRRLRGTAAR